MEKQPHEMTRSEYVQNNMDWLQRRQIKSVEIKNMSELQKELRGDIARSWSRRKAYEMVEHLLKNGWKVLNPREAETTTSIYFEVRGPNGETGGFRVSDHSSTGPRRQSKGLRGKGNQIELAPNTNIQQAFDHLKRQASQPKDPRDFYKAEHEYFVAWAISENKIVSSDVLKDYPGLLNEIKTHGMVNRKHPMS